MNNKRLEELKKVLPLYLEKQLDININKPFNCLNPEHNDRTPSMSYDAKRNKVHCFSCGVDWDIFDLVGAVQEITDKKEVFKLVEAYADFIYKDNGNQNQNENEQYTHMNIHTSVNINKNISSNIKDENINDDDGPIIMDYFNKVHKNINKTDYLKKRGLSDKVINQFLIGYEESFTEGTGGKSWKAVIIPTSPSTYVARNTDTEADKRNRVRKHGANLIFNSKIIKYPIDDYIFITEGEIDAMSFYEVGYNAVGLGSTSNINKLLSILKVSSKPKKPLFIVLDNDEEGKKKTKELIMELDKMGIDYYYSFDFYEGYKDANEYLVNDRQGFIKSIQEAIKTDTEKREEEREEYLKNSTSNYIQDFINGITESVNTPYTPTGFNKLDEILDGGLYEGLYICGAISSLGKTTLITQICDQIAQNGQDVIIFSLEMARAEIMAKSISRLTLLEVQKNKHDLKNAKTTRGVTTGTRYPYYSDLEKEIIKNSINKYKDYSSHIFIHEGIGNIGVEQVRKTIEKHIKITGNKPVVVIDYIQILAPYDVRATDKQNMDHAVLELKRISRDLKLPIIGISSFNRASYKEKVGMEAFKESGALEYGSDVLIGLQLKGVGDRNFNVDEAKAKNPREIELVILKNRNGATGKTVYFQYYSMFNYFKEM